jgi:hypothetical protein
MSFERDSEIFYALLIVYLAVTFALLCYELVVYVNLKIRLNAKSRVCWTVMTLKILIKMSLVIFEASKEDFTLYTWTFTLLWFDA